MISTVLVLYPGPWTENRYTRKNAQPIASCQQAWTICCAANCEQCCAAPSEQCCQQCCSSMITMLLQHCSNINTNFMITMLFYQYCFFPVPTTVNNRCSFINAEQHCCNTVIVNSIVRSTTLLKSWYRYLYCYKHCSINNVVTTCAIFSCVYGRAAPIGSYLLSTID